MNFRGFKCLLNRINYKIILIVLILLPIFNLCLVTFFQGNEKIKVNLPSSSNSVVFEWYKTWGGSFNDKGESVAVDSSDNVYVGGYTDSFGAGSYDSLLIKYDSSGNQQWNHTWGGSTVGFFWESLGDIFGGDRPLYIRSNTDYNSSNTNISNYLYKSFQSSKNMGFNCYNYHYFFNFDVSFSRFLCSYFYINNWRISINDLWSYSSNH